MRAPFIFIVSLAFLAALFAVVGTAGAAYASGTHVSGAVLGALAAVALVVVLVPPLIAARAWARWRDVPFARTFGAGVLAWSLLATTLFALPGGAKERMVWPTRALYGAVVAPTPNDAPGTVASVAAVAAASAPSSSSSSSSVPHEPTTIAPGTVVPIPSAVASAGEGVSAAPGAPAAAVQALVKAEAELAAAPKDITAIEKAAVARTHAGRVDAALALLKSCLPGCSLTYAMLVAQTDDASEALATFSALDMSQGTDSDRTWAYVTYSTALLKTGKVAEAVQAARKALAITSAMLPKRQLAIALFFAGNRSESEALLTQVVASNPDDGAARYWQFRWAKKAAAGETRALGQTAYDALRAEVGDLLWHRGDLHLALADVASELGKATEAADHKSTASMLRVTRVGPLGR